MYPTSVRYAVGILKVWEFKATSKLQRFRACSDWREVARDILRLVDHLASQES